MHIKLQLICSKGNYGIKYDKINLQVLHANTNLFKSSSELFSHVKSIKSLKCEKFHKHFILIPLWSTQKTIKLLNFCE